MDNEAVVLERHKQHIKSLQIGDTYDGENFWRDGEIVTAEQYKEITGEFYE